MVLKQKMQDHGAVIFRDFDLMKTSEGQVLRGLWYEGVLDLLHLVAARLTVDGKKEFARVRSRQYRARTFHWYVHN
jgi:hypothetical protein